MGIIEHTNIENAKKAIKKEAKPIIILGQEDNFNRKIMEYGNFDVLLSPEKGKRKDSLKFLDSGLNEVFGRIAEKNNVKIGIDLKELRTLDKKEKAVRIARIRQNIRLCRKTGAKLLVFGDVDSRNALSLLISLGASTSQARQAISF